MKFFIIILAYAFLCNSTYAESEILNIEINNIKNNQQLEFGPRLPKLLENKMGTGTSVIIHEDDWWQVLRSFPEGYIDVFYRNNVHSQYKRIPLPIHIRKNSYPMLFLANEGVLYTILYDVIANIPSGRTSFIEKNGYDVYQIDAKSQNIELLHQDLKLGSIDNPIYGELIEDRLSICGSGECYTIINKAITKWNTSFLNEYEFIEIIFKNELAAAIIRLRHDDRTDGVLLSKHSQYSISIFDSVTGIIKTLPSREIPYQLRWDGKNIAYSDALNTKQLSSLYWYDFNRMPFGGNIDFGVNNFEGRVAWSQVYYLSGLIAYLEGGIDYLKFDRPIVLKRLCSEVNLIAELADNDYPGYLSKRYSLDREPLLSALHLGRINELLIRSKDVGCLIPQKYLNHLRSHLDSLSKTIETDDDLFYSGRNWRYLKIRKGIPFWADGSNAPYNYVSGYLKGYWAGNNSPKIKKTILIKPLLELELKSFPITWRYWWGVGDDGWTEDMGLSLNTPEYLGNRGAIAHISYRSMDASALITYARMTNSQSELIAHLRTLHSNGMLLPHLAEDFKLLGLKNRLDLLVARRFSRAANWAELHSQVWALDQLVKYISD